MLNSWTVSLISITAGLVYFVYQYYNNEHYQHSHNGRRPPTDEEYEYELPNPTRNIRDSPVPPPSNDELCTICSDYLLRRNTSRSYCIISLPNCRHWFHQACALRLLEYHPNCPNCRTPIDRDNLRRTPVRLIDYNRNGSVSTDGDTTQPSDPNMTTNERSRQEIRSKRSGYREDSLD